MQSAPIRSNRRGFLTGLTATAGFSASALAKPVDAQSPTGTLKAFLAAFERCDLAAMESFFARDTTYFDRFPPGAQDAAKYMRGFGMPAGMRDLCSALLKAGGQPPYHRVEPEDLMVQKYSDVAVCTFHLTGDHVLGRRTVVLNRRGAAWKIVHIHASNMPLAA